MSPVAAPPRRRGRRCGFERPLSANQIVSWVGNVVVTGLFYALIAYLLLVKRECRSVVLVVLLLCHLVCVVGGFSSWLFLEIHVPTQPSFFGRLLPDAPRWTKTRYSREHADVVPGLDHFCTWLNTAIGRSNYIPFFALALLGTLQYAIHTAACLYLAITCRRLGTALQIVFSALALCGLLALSAYLSLLTFHVYLSASGIGTYDWISQQRQAASAHTPTQHASSKSIAPSNDDDDGDDGDDDDEASLRT